MEEKGFKFIIIVEARTIQKFKANLEKNYEAWDIGVNEDKLLTENDRVTRLRLPIFFYNLQQTKKRVNDLNHKRISENIGISSNCLQRLRKC